jgi:RNA 3'-terminal phosphate cyclase (ATP)
MVSPDPSNTVCLDGRTLEGGGQLVRNAVALSALTGQAVAIHHIRGNREGKRGLKKSHLAGVKLLAEVSESDAKGAELGSSSLHFSQNQLPYGAPDSFPQRLLSPKPIQPEYNIHLPTAGSVFLVFQALYPYLLYAGASQARPIRLNLTGGTNVSHSPSYDYVSQVLVPNFARLGLPRLEVRLRKRGWATGPVDLGTVTLLVDPLDLPASPARIGGMADGETEAEATPHPRFPAVDMGEHQRGPITKVDITVLAPDKPVRPEEGAGERNKESRRPGAWREDQPSSHLKGDTTQDADADADADSQPETVRQFLQNETIAILSERLNRLPASLFDHKPSAQGTSNDPVPIAIHTSEQTQHLSHVYILLVAHTSNGFKLGRDALFGVRAGKTAQSRAKKREGKPGESRETNLMRQARRCVDGFIEEISSPTALGSHKPCVDVYMRDQVVVFEALGRVDERDRGERDFVAREDERDWSLHTRTARWVCEEVLGVRW